MRMWSTTPIALTQPTMVFGSYNFHPDRCEDWNLETGGNTDWDEPLVAPFSGLVLVAHDWYGKIGGVVPLLGRQHNDVMIVWGGWHLHQILVRPGETVCVGDDIGTIGNAHGVYSSHLHEQICIVNEWGIPSPTRFPSDGRYQWVRPSVFYKASGVSPDLVERCKLRDGA